MYEMKTGTLEDLKSVLDENLDAWDKKFVKDAVNMHERFYLDHLDQPLVIKDKERVVSFMTYALCRRLGYVSLMNIFTVKDHRGRGLGDNLWLRLHELALGHPNMKYIKWLSHDTSLCFYKKHGCEPKGKLPKGDYLFVEPLGRTTPEEDEKFFAKMKEKYKCAE